MRKLTSHSKTGLFLMEMILSLLILSLACAACIQIFASAHTSRTKAREFNHIQELTVTVGEILEGCDGQGQSVLALLPDGREDHGVLKYYYDKAWQSCAPGEEAYQMHLALTQAPMEKGGELSFYDAEGNELYHLALRFPRTAKEEALS